MKNMLTIIIICFVSITMTSAAQRGLYFAEPKFVHNSENPNPKLTEFFFYLQQMSKYTVYFNGIVSFKRRVGPLQAVFDLLVWGGRSFRRPSGATGALFLPDACALPETLTFLESLQPSSDFKTNNCSFESGNYTIEVDYNDLLHKLTDFAAYEPQKLKFEIMEDGKLLFGLTLEMHFYDLTLYNFIPKD